MRSWRLGVLPAIALSLVVMIGAITKNAPSKEVYYLIGLAVGGYCAFATSRKIKEEAIKKIELQ